MLFEPLLLGLLLSLPLLLNLSLLLGLPLLLGLLPLLGLHGCLPLLLLELTLLALSLLRLELGLPLFGLLLIGLLLIDLPLPRLPLLLALLVRLIGLHVGLVLRFEPPRTGGRTLHHLALLRGPLLFLSSRRGRLRLLRLGLRRQGWRCMARLRLLP